MQHSLTKWIFITSAGLFVIALLSGCGTINPTGVSDDVKSTIAAYYEANKDRELEILNLKAADPAGITISGIKELSVRTQADPVRAIPSETSTWATFWNGLWDVGRWGVAAYGLSEIVDRSNPTVVGQPAPTIVEQPDPIILQPTPVQ